MYGRVVINTHDEDRGALEAKARGGVIAIVTNTPGYISYGVMFEDHRLVSVSQWESEEYAKAADSALAEWVHANTTMTSQTRFPGDFGLLELAARWASAEQTRAVTLRGVTASLSWPVPWVMIRSDSGKDWGTAPLASPTESPHRRGHLRLMARPFRTERRLDTPELHLFSACTPPSVSPPPRRGASGSLRAHDVSVFLDYTPTINDDTLEVAEPFRLGPRANLEAP